MKKFLKYLSIVNILIFCGDIKSSYQDYIYPSTIPDFSNYGTLGLIQMPSARLAEEGTLAFSWTHNEPYLRGSIVAYPFSWFEASYQYADINNALYSPSAAFSGSQTLKDKSFDAKFRLIKETNYMPQIAVGLRDLAGTSVFAAEYFVASKFINNFDFTLGIGWGNLNGNSIKNPFNALSDSFQTRTGPLSGGGQFSTGAYFSGKAGYFGGIEYFIPKFRGARIKLELDGTNYQTEGPLPLAQDQKINFSYVHPITDNFLVKASYIKGNTFSFGFSYRAPLGRKNPYFPKQDRMKPVVNKDAIRLVTSKSDENLYKASLLYLGQRSLFLQAANIQDGELKVAYAQSKFRTQTIAAGRALRILDDIAPDTINKIEVSEINGDMGMYTISSTRAALTASKTYQDPSILLPATEISPLKFNKGSYAFNPKIKYPRFFYHIGPDIKSQIGGPDGFYFGDLRISAHSELLLRSDLSLITVLSQGVTNNFSNLKLPSDSVLPHVRTDIVDYLKEGTGFTIRRMQLNYFKNPLENLYFKFSAGIFESMFAGAGFEALYRPFSKNYGVGIDAWRVRQRAFDQRFDFREYETSTGHITLYLKEPNSKILFKLIGGKYLAQDSGITVDISRKFYSGFQVGIFASKTDISKYEFGEGSFDKGFYWWLPVDLFFGDYRKQSTGWGLRPLTRDGAQRLVQGYPLWGVTDYADGNNITTHWNDIYD
jgi:hypothetical protein